MSKATRDLNRVGGLNNVVPSQFLGAVRYQANKQKVPEAIALAVIHVESRGNVKANSPVGAKGLFQIMDGTAGDLRIDNRNPAQNIEGCIRYLRQLNDRYHGDWEKTFAAYNWGMGRVDNAQAKYKSNWRSALPEETSNYLAQFRAVLNNGRPL